MTTKENKAIARRFLEEAWNQGQVEQLDEYYAPDGSAPDMTPLQDLKSLILWWHKAAPGLKFTILNILAEGETVMVHWQVDVTYTVPTEPLPDEPFIPLGKPVSWKGVDIYRIVDGKIVSEQNANPWYGMLVEVGAIPLKKIELNKAAARKFVDAVNRQDTALLAEVCTPELAKEWTEALPGMYASMKDHHIELVDMVADGESVAVKMATSGYHTGELFGLPPTGNWWTNRVFTFFRLADGKIVEVDPLPDSENHIKQIGGTIQPAAA